MSRRAAHRHDPARRRLAAVCLVSTAVLAGCGGGASPTGAAGPGASDQARIAAALRVVAQGCSTPARAGDRARQVAVTAAARTLVGFQRRYPDQRFRLEAGGEEGRMLSVLLVARYEARRCAPIVRVIDRALPVRVRAALPPPTR